MQTRASLQRRHNPESGDRLAANMKPRSWDHPLHEQAQPQSPSAGFDLSNIDLFSHAPQRPSVPNAIQAKLSVGAPNDQYEQEADRVAEQVLSMPDSATQQPVQRAAMPEEEEIQAKPLAATITPLIQREAMPEEEEEPIQAKAIQREAMPEEEEPLQAKAIQREAMPEEEEPLQAKLIQREAMPEEEEEPVQAKAIQREAMPEEEELQRKPSLQRAADGNLQTGNNLESQLNSSQGGGAPLPEAVRSFMEPRFGVDFSGVRVHTGSESVQMNRELNAQAFTHKQDVYFGAGRAPGNDALTAHELTHVVQQTGAIGRKLIQRKIEPSYDVTQGKFQVGATAGGSNFPIDIAFQPNPTADYSNQISLIQIVRVTDAGGQDLPVPSATLPPGRVASLRTTADTSAGVEAGYFTDAYHNNPNAQPNAALPPQYGYGPATNPTGTGTIPTPGLSRPLSPTFAPVPDVGFKRSNDPADIKTARIHDAPGYPSATPLPPDLNFHFETVAKGEDVNKVYGSLHWNFQLRAGVAQNENATVQDAQSATFDAALERHRDFYVHEPVIFYFDFDQDTLSSTEIAKIATFKAYLARFAAAPNLVRVTPEGFADQRGNADYNLALSRRRATAVRNALLAEGIPPAQINPVTVSGETTGFTPDATTDQDTDANRRGNRRVVLQFAHVPAPAAPGGTP